MVFIIIKYVLFCKVFRVFVFCLLELYMLDVLMKDVMLFICFW